MTDFKPGDKVRVTIDCTIDRDDGTLEPIGGGYTYIPGFTQGDRLSLADMQHLFEANIAPLVDAPEPYTEPRHGDEVEATVRGRISPLMANYNEMRDSQNRIVLSGAQLAEALSEGRVRLVKAATPRYEPGRLYCSESEPHKLYRAAPPIWCRVTSYPAGRPTVADMSDPYDAMQLTVDHCSFMSTQALKAAREAQVRAEVWADAADQARKHLADYEKWNPRPTSEGTDPA